MRGTGVFPGTPFRGTGGKDLAEDIPIAMNSEESTSPSSRTLIDGEAEGLSTGSTVEPVNFDSRSGSASSRSCLSVLFPRRVSLDFLVWLQGVFACFRLAFALGCFTFSLFFDPSPDVPHRAIAPALLLQLSEQYCPVPNLS